MVDISQTEKEIIIKIPLLCEISSNKLDVVLLEKFVKLNYPPTTYFEAYLEEEIDVNKSILKLFPKEAKFILIKKNDIIWPTILKNVHKSETVKLKTEIIDEIQKRNQLKQTENNQRKDEQKRIAIEKQIENESLKLEKIKLFKSESTRKEIQDVDKLKEENLKIEKSKKETKLSVQEIRSIGKIEFSFSDFKHKVPKRENLIPADSSTKSTENRLFKLQDATKLYKKQGDEFFKNHEYEKALAAYNKGLETDQTCYEIYMNRSAVNFATKNYIACIRDCSTAYELLHESLESVDRLKATCKSRRGAALCKLGQFKSGYKDLCDAVESDPNNKSLQEDAEKIQRKLETI